MQFEALLDGGPDSIYFEMAAHANRMAKKLREGLAELGVAFFGDSRTNQIFPILPGDVVRELEKEFLFYRWTQEKNGMIPMAMGCWYTFMMHARSMRSMTEPWRKLKWMPRIWMD